MSRFATPYDAVMSQYGQPSYAQRRLDAAKKYNVTHLIDQYQRERDAMLVMQSFGEPVSDGRFVYPMYDIIHPELNLEKDGILYYFVLSDEEIEAEVILMAGAWYFEALSKDELSKMMSPAVQDALYSRVWNKRRRDDITLLRMPEEEVLPEFLNHWKILQARFKGEEPQPEQKA